MIVLNNDSVDSRKVKNCATIFNFPTVWVINLAVVINYYRLWQNIESIFIVCFRIIFNVFFLIVGGFLYRQTFVMM